MAEVEGKRIAIVGGGLVREIALKEYKFFTFSILVQRKRREKKRVIVFVAGWSISRVFFR